LVEQHKLDFIICNHSEKQEIAGKIVDHIQSLHPPGRFLKTDSKTDLRLLIDRERALRKTSQALRVGAPDLIEMITPGPTSSETTRVNIPRKEFDDTELHNFLFYVFGAPLATDKS